MFNAPLILPSTSIFVQDQRLVKAIGQCGGGVGQAGFSWRAVVNLMNGRSLRQCQRRWHDHLKFPVRGEVHSSTDWTVNEVCSPIYIVCY